ncbi:hypothetical protein RclHR1_04120002 [Rhizophagus clarus]|uniref:Uncharacterized protein n=1 Tax=Rhizophagus clarus TaxID=94130 RepID=A0A2Z6RXW9_9GLOM|nr:hypothetical protein RclHR1_04120002 [Rhizophagus clarus]
MPAKISTIYYLHDFTERLTQEFTVKEITAVARLDDNDPTKIVYLRGKAFIPVDQNILCQIEDFSNGQVVFLKGKFVTCASWYSVNATSIKTIDNMGFDDMPAIGLNVMILGLTTKTVRNVDSQSIIDFYVKENLGDRELGEFWVEVRHNANLRYLANKTNAINQSMRSSTALLVGTLTYQGPVLDETTGDETSPGKHILTLDDISLISTNRNPAANPQQSSNVPWLNSRTNTRAQCPAQGASPRTFRRGRGSSSQMRLRSSSLASALSSNPVPTMIAGAVDEPQQEASEE